MMKKSFGLLVLFFLSNPLLAVDPELVWKEIHNSRLDVDRAVHVESLRLETGLAVLQIQDGVIFPASAVGERSVEMVFLGDARLVLEPPNGVEAHQLELFTDSPRLEEEISEAVLVVAIDAAADVIAARPPADAGADTARARELFERWRSRPERRLLGVDTAILRDAVGDPAYRGYFAGWFRGRELGEFLFVFEPDAHEQATLGQFTELEATEKQRRQLARRLHRAQRKGRLIGLSVADLGDWDTWLSTSMVDAAGEQRPGSRAFEPELYELDASLDAKLDLTGRARLHVKALYEGARILRLELDPDLEVSDVRAGGRDLFFHQSGGEVVAVLDEARAKDDALIVEVDYAGRVIEKVDRAYTVTNTTQWYPHAGSVDLAKYDVTLHWPEKFDLVAGGTYVDGGTEDGKRRFMRRRLDRPTFAFGFEVGKFKTLEAEAGHVKVKLHYDPVAGTILDKESREELLATLGDALTFFEETFGPYPFDELVAVTVPRDYSQSLLGFVTLSTLSMADVSLFSLLLGLEDRRTVVAHELAHQWWGHMVAWESYRDQWISEAMANYAAVLYARAHLGHTVFIGPTSGWQDALTSVTAEGRTIESIGPLVLGERLASSRADAYQAVVYKKGAVVLDMLSRLFAPGDFVKVLRTMVGYVDFRPVSTPIFFELIERGSGRDLDGFVEQFVYGTGLPEIYYNYDFEQKADGKWRVSGTARQESPYRYSYRVIERGGTFDVARERLDQIEVTDSSLVVPFQVAVYNPAAGVSKAQKRRKLDPKTTGNAVIAGRAMLKGRATEIGFDLDFEPKELWLDKNGEVFGRFFNERRQPKRMLYYQGLDLAAASDIDKAEDLYRRALEAEAFSGPAYTEAERDSHKSDERWLDARIHLQLTRLYLDADRTAEAGASFERAQKLLTAQSRYWLRGEVKTLEARLALNAGEAERAYKLLKKAVLRRGDVEGTEGILLLAIAARAAGHSEDYEAALEVAREKGADVGTLPP